MKIDNLMREATEAGAEFNGDKWTISNKTNKVQYRGLLVTIKLVKEHIEELEEVRKQIRELKELIIE